MNKNTAARAGTWPLALFTLALSSSSRTAHEWGGEFDTPGLQCGTIMDSAVFDDGTGPAL